MARRSLTAALFAAALMSVASAATAQDPGEFRRSTFHDYRVVTVAEGLTQPWSMAFLPNGDMLVTEKSGTLRLVQDGMVRPDPVAGVPAVSDRGQGGLLDVVLHPDFRNNRYVYLTYSKPLEGGDAATTAIGRGVWEDGELRNFTDLMVTNSQGRNGHYGSRIVFDGNGYMFFTVGDRQVMPAGSRGDLEAHPSQDVTNHNGTVNRLHDDGRIPADNPFVGTAGAEGSVWSYGHRNPQGMAMDRATGELWATEHGPQGGDELNRIQPGLNYGWPVVGYGVNYGSGSTIHVGTRDDEMEHPVHVWVPSIATSGLIVYDGERFPAWQGNIFSGGLGGQVLVRLTVDEDRSMSSERLLEYAGRIRDVRQGPDGFIYVAIDDRRGPSAILRLEPAD